MKLLLLFVFLFFMNFVFAQSLDYISVRKKNGSVVKNFYSGSSVLLQLTGGNYLMGPIKTIKNDSVFVVLYDIRWLPTIYGTRIRDTVSTTLIGINYKDIQRIHLAKKQGFVQRSAGPLLMIAGGGYLVLNVLNGAFFNLPVTDSQNLKTLGIAAGTFAIG